MKKQRKLIRPSLDEYSGKELPKPKFPRERSSSRRQSGEKRTEKPSFAPPYTTFEEPGYYQELIRDKTPLVIVLKDGDEYHGYLEYYDKRFLRITREGQSNLFILKSDIKYFYEEHEG